MALLATIILLSYSSLIQNIINIFSIGSLDTPNNSTKQIWLVDGNFDYGTGKHAVLVVIAVVFLILFIFPHTLILTFSQFLQKVSCTSKCLQRFRLQPFIDVYQAPFRPTHRYWVGLCLLMRVVLLTVFATAESIHISLLAIIISCLISLSMFRATGGIYKKKWIDILEMSFILNLGILATCTWYFTIVWNQSYNNRVAAYTSISIAIITSIIIVSIHIFWRLQKFPQMRKKINHLLERAKTTDDVEVKSKTKATAKRQATSQIVELEETNTVQLREPLLDD